MSAIEALYIFDEHKYVSNDAGITIHWQSLTCLLALSFSIMSIPIAHLHLLLSYLSTYNSPHPDRVSPTSPHSTHR